MPEQFVQNLCVGGGKTRLVPNFRGHPACAEIVLNLCRGAPAQYFGGLLGMSLYKSQSIFRRNFSISQVFRQSCMGKNVSTLPALPR